MIELTDVDSTNLVRLLYASARKAVGEKIVPSADNRKPYTNKAQKVCIFTSQPSLKIFLYALCDVEVTSQLLYFGSYKSCIDCFLLIFRISVLVLNLHW